MFLEDENVPLVLGGLMKLSENLLSQKDAQEQCLDDVSIEEHLPLHQKL